jgi:glyoxylase-like metal-dependent hydrolase (beta-lactamase superfamily II)
MPDVRISSVNGNSQWLDGGSMFGNVPRPVWAKWMPPDDLGRIRLLCRALLVETGGKRILCETGIGVFFEPKLAERFGVGEKRHVLLDSLHDLGLTDKDIDAVILSHLHFDHAGGLLPAYEEIQAGRDDLLFPNAEFIVGAAAWERANHPHARDRASFIPGLTEKLKKSGRLRIVQRDRAGSLFDDVVSFRYSDGHTPGQMHTIVRGREKTVVFAGDLIPGTSWVHLAVTMGYDRNPELVIDEKEALYRDLVSPDLMLFYTHDPEFAASGVEKDAAGKYVPVHKIPVLKRQPV